MDSLAGNGIQDLEDSALDGKIERTKRLMASKGIGPLSDNGHKLKLFLQKLLAERERRNQSPRQKAETDKASTAQRSEMVDCMDNSQSVHQMPKFAPLSCGLAAVRNSKVEDNKSTKDSSAFSSDDKSGCFSHPMRNFSTRNGRRSSFTYGSHVGNRVFSPGHKVSSGRADNNSDSDIPANFSGDELGYCSHGRHKKFRRNDNPHLVTPNRTRNHVFSSGHEDSSCRPKNSLITEGNHGKFLSNKISEQPSFSALLGEEKDCTQLAAGKRKEALSLTQQGQTKKKIPGLIVLDEEDREQPKEQQTRRMSKRWTKNMAKDLKVYYPARDDPESVEICYSDMECLAPFSYLSSPIMNFYIRYLQSPESTITSKQCTNYHFFNTYFYNKLDEALQNHRRQRDGDSLTKLRRWLKGVNIFEKAYIFVPIYYRQHWSLAVICIPAREKKIGPIILHLDSLGLHTSNIIFQNIRSFMKAEWEHLNQAGVPTHIPMEESVWKTLINKIETKNIQVPQQENDYDCGLFVLYFMERFIKDAPTRLVMSDLHLFGRKWFRPAEASRLRDSIKTLLEKHFEDAKNNKLDAIAS